MSVERDPVDPGTIFPDPCTTPLPVLILRANPGARYGYTVRIRDTIAVVWSDDATCLVRK